VIRLTPAVREPQWVELGDGVAVRVRPLTSAVYQGAQIAAARAAREARAAALGGGEVDAILNTDEAARDGRYAALFAEWLLRLAAIDWRGVGDEAGAELPPTPENLSWFAAVAALHAERFTRLYTAALDALAAEKNASPPASTTTRESGANPASPAAS
jgi:hypothetical protein